ncbi:hypothetical protein KNT87_gp092 [Erwinia phage Cronus]|uniref:Uncharacterized protein n=1 Tax=Erwinia phage Cronus TaxID=2163633 RepID=A0A2S1GMB5_9CAUD|nr:hypothetical protein KNT87_gp092 [Erwinia phage Cronus]AWD90531.1 hypothetical protein [Erwinia phage Cronus]
MDVAQEYIHLHKMISIEVAEEFCGDFASIIVKIKFKMDLDDDECNKLVYLYNRYHGTTEIVTSTQLLENLYV